jgi:hypothetical protein
MRFATVIGTTMINSESNGDEKEREGKLFDQTAVRLVRNGMRNGLETLEVIIDEFSHQSFQGDRKNTV